MPLAGCYNKRIRGCYSSWSWWRDVLVLPGLGHISPGTRYEIDSLRIIKMFDSLTFKWFQYNLITFSGQYVNGFIIAYRLTFIK